MFHNQVQQYTTQIRQLCQQLESSERMKANQLQQITQVLDQFARQEVQGAQIALQLSQITNQVDQIVSQVANQVQLQQQLPVAQTGFYSVQSPVGIQQH